MNDRTRAYLYRIATPLAGLLVAYGFLSEGAAAQWLSLIGAVLLVAEGGLAAHNTSTDKVPPEADEPGIP